jgi:N-acetylglutamate synthase-like GNAT family acetyltransferase
MPHLFKIRKATPVDAKAISALIIPLVKEFISYEYSEQGAALILKSMSAENILSNINQSFEYFVAEEKNKVIGVLGIKLGSHVFHCFVDKNYHRKQLGEKLWEYWLARTKAKEVTVNSSKFAIKFYQALGFKSNNEIFEKNGVTCYPMVYKKV